MHQEKVENLPFLEIKNKPLYAELIARNKQSYFEQSAHDYYFQSVQKPDIFLKSLDEYARYLQASWNKNKKLTKQDIIQADNFAELSIKFYKDFKFEGFRLWADVILGQTWTYGENLLKTEGFSCEEIKAIQAPKKIPYTYRTYEEMLHPIQSSLLTVIQIFRNQPISHIIKHRSFLPFSPINYHEREE